MNTEANIHNITDLPLEILNYLCTHLTWLDVVMLELAIPYLRMEQCGIHYDFKLKKLKQLIRQLRKLKRKQQKYHERFRFTMYMYNYNPKCFLQSHMVKAIIVIRKQNHYLYLIKKVEEELQVKFLVEEVIDVFCSYCETRFSNVRALETHSKIIFPKCRVISIEDLQQWLIM
jgi:hypothetical protein